MNIDRVLMCEPTYFDIEYVINPWMDTNNRVNKERARMQWERVRDVLTSLGVAVEYIEPAPGLPDMTFIGDAGLVNGKTFAASHFRHHQRQREAEVTSVWMKERGYDIILTPEDVFFEGLGDVIYSPTGIIVGHGPRSSPESVGFVKQIFPELKVVGEVHLCDAWFYHTALAAALISDDKVVYYSPALTAGSRRLLESKFDQRIEISERDAKEFMVCNNIVVGRHVLVHDCSSEFERALNRWGYEVIRCQADEFLKSGGSVRCLILNL